MKLVTLTFLEGDLRCLERLLAEQGVQSYSVLPLEGHGRGSRGGWRGEVLPFRSMMIYAFVPEALAGRVLDAVRDCDGITDTRHPVRAFQLAVERDSRCRCADDDPSRVEE